MSTAETESPPEPHQPDDKPPPPKPWSAKRRIVVWALVILALIASLWWGVPAVMLSLDTVSTDDAYVNGHVTFVASRVAGQVRDVLVEDNNRVKKGDVLVRLDPEPYRVQVALKKAALDAAGAKLTVARANTRAAEALARSQRYKLQNAIEQVNNQVAALKAAAATLKSRQATRDRAKSDLARTADLAAKQANTREDLDQKKEALRVADATTDVALQEAYQIRVGLGLPSQPPEGQDLASVPADLAQNFSGVREALGELAQSAAKLGLPLPGTDVTPDQFIESFKKRDASGDVDKILESLVPNAPEVKQAQALLEQAKADLDQAELNLKYCEVRAEIDGVVTRRNVNPGNNLQAGQQVLAVRSLTQIWIDCNFKETQLADLAIGQRVEVKTDIYGSERVYQGRITGFTYGTGSTLSLLPAQNATGNFVKVVQRLPVRVELDNYDPDEFTLFAGLSVEPRVYFKEKPAGPNAGQKLQDAARDRLPAGPNS